MVAFGESDEQVIDAIERAGHFGGMATYDEIRHHLPGVPTQRLTGMARRGLLYSDGREWAITNRGRDLADEYRREHRRYPFWRWMA